MIGSRRHAGLDEDQDRADHRQGALGLLLLLLQELEEAELVRLSRSQLVAAAAAADHPIDVLKRVPSTHRALHVVLSAFLLCFHGSSGRRLQNLSDAVFPWDVSGPRWTVYILRCRTGELYTGITTDVERRLKQHNSGAGSKFTRSRRPVILVHREEAKSRSEALRREHFIKTMSRREKESLLSPGSSGPVNSRS